MHKYVITKQEIREFDWDRASDEAKCVQMRREDHYYYTHAHSLKHHNHRCPIHGDKGE